MHAGAGGLKRTREPVETLGVKACPFCQAELRDSVIRCTRCGRSLRVDQGSTAPPPSAVTAARGSGGPFVPASLAASPGTPSRTTAPAPSPPVWAVSTRTPSVPTRTPDHSARRALPSDRRRSGRADLGLWLAAAA